MKYEKYVDIYIGIKFSLQTPKLNLLCFMIYHNENNWRDNWMADCLKWLKKLKDNTFLW